MPDRRLKNAERVRSREHPSQRPETLAAPRALGATRRQLAFATLILFLICTGTIFDSLTATAVVYDFTTGTAPRSARAETIGADYSKFSHSAPKEHADLMGRANCVSCHRRNDSSPSPRLPVHRDCTGCHLVQFTGVTSSENPICTICHTKDGLNSSNPPIKSLSGLGSFNAKFDHAQHMAGVESARPGAGCAACHTPANRGVAQTIPSRLNGHQTCYQCHSPGKPASKFSSCGSCHDFGRYSRTPTAARSYRVGFGHADHSARRRLSCETCHRVKGRRLPQAQQVSSILAAQHYPNPRAHSCKTCHNGKRAFGDTGPGFTDCVRCHKGLNFKS